MSKHLADHQSTTESGRLEHFFRIARDRSEAAWRVVWKQPRPRMEAVRVVEYARIERGHQV